MPAELIIRRLPLPPLAGLALIVLAVLGGIWLGWTQTEANRWVRHTLAVEIKIAEALEVVRGVESAHRGYLIAGNPVFAADLDRQAGLLRLRLDELARETSDNPAQARALQRLRAYTNAKLAFAQQGVTLAREGRRDAAVRLVDSGRGRALMEAIDAELMRMKASEERLLEQRSAKVRHVIWWLAAGQAIAVMLVLAVAAATIRDARQRSAAMEQARDAARSAEAAIRHEMAAREAAESQLRQLQKMESIGQLTGGIAHDFNNMLAIVIGSLDMAKRRMTGEPEKLIACLDNAREGAERAAALTSRLLAFSRQQPLAPLALDANRLVSGMSDMLRRTLGEQIEVETVLAGGLWRTYADPLQLENAILNLAVNARDAMADAEGSRRLTIETNNAHLDDDYARSRIDVEPGQYVLISVSDTGTGMNPDVIARAFDPFFTTKAVGKGTGLGLSQVFGFAKQSGGHASIYSEPGEGTTVKLYLPRFTGTAGDEAAAAAVPETLPEGTADEIVLVVEDEQRVRQFSCDALRDLGYTAISAPGGREALVLLEEQPSIALLFTDVVMPEMNGRRLADEALALRPGLKILYTTGYTRNAVVHNGMLDVGVAFLPKPFTIAQLALKVREVLDGGGVNRPA